MKEVLQCSARALGDLVASRQLSAREVVDDFLDRARELDSTLHAWTEWFDDDARREADSIDARIGRGEQVGPLAGVPVAVKDNICVSRHVTSAGSHVLSRYVAPYDATVVERLRQAGAIVTGKTNLDEFGMGSSTETSVHGPTHNPWDLTRSPGGSSGGSAAAVASRGAAVALGSDTGGSLRQPAAFCGAVGLRPTYGRVSRFGLIAFASSLDQVGPLTSNVRDAAALLEVLAGCDARDATTQEREPPRADRLRPEVKGLRVGLVEDENESQTSREVETAVRDAARRFESAGASVEKVELPHARYAVPTYYLVANAEASSNLARYDGVRYGHRAGAVSDLLDLYTRSRTEGFGREVKRRIMIGTYGLSAGYYDAFYLQAQKVRSLIRRDFERAFERVDLILGPVAPTPAFRLGEKLDDPLAMYLSDVYTTPASLAGLPAISLPAGLTRGASRLPLAVQLMAPPFEEERLLGAAAWLESDLGPMPMPPGNDPPAAESAP